MNGKRIQINLVVGSIALVLITLAAIMPSYVQAANVAYVATNPAPLSALCSDTSAQETNRYRDYGTFTSYWNSCENPIGTSNLELTGPDRNYGTFAGVWTGYMDRVAAADLDLTGSDRNYGTFAGVWTGYIDRVAVEDSADSSFLAANPELMVARRYTAAPASMTDAAFLAVPNR